MTRQREWLDVDRTIADRDVREAEARAAGWDGERVWRYELNCSELRPHYPHDWRSVTQTPFTCAGYMWRQRDAAQSWAVAEDSGSIAAYREAYAAAETPARRMELFYGLPEDTLSPGRRVLFEDKPGVITGIADEGAYVLIQLDGETVSGLYHPTWNLTYMPPGGAA